MDNDLYLMLTLVGDSIKSPNQMMFHSKNWSFSNSTHLVFEPNRNGVATMIFKFTDFIELDLNAFVRNLKQAVHSRFPFRFDRINIKLHVVFDSEELTSDVKAMISNISDFFASLRDPFVQYIDDESINEIEMPSAFSLNEGGKKSKKDKKLKFEKESIKPQTSEVWRKISEDQRKKLFGQFGYLATSDKAAVKHDTELIFNFINQLIVDDSKFASKFKKELLNRWVNTFVRLVEWFLIIYSY